MKFAVLLLVALTLQAAPDQPVPFSHKHHAGTLKLKCNMCHPNRDPGETMGIAASKVCMQCHTAIKTDSPHIQKIAASAAENRPMKWVRVYQIPTYVIFSHRTHTEAGNICQDCHGPVPEREVLTKEGDISMTGCMNCHKAKNASNDCTFCHEPQKNQ